MKTSEGRFITLTKGQRLPILHVEEDVLWSDAIADALRSLPDFTLLGTASTGECGLQMCRELAPNILILEMSLPDIDGLLFLDQLKSRPNPPRVLLLTRRFDPAVLCCMGANPVVGIIWKNREFGRELRAALAVIAAGGNYLNAKAEEARQHFRSSPDAYFKILSQTELKLLPAIALGYSDGEIGDRMGCKASTVHTHRSSIYSKLNSSRSRLLSWAINTGILHLPRMSLPGVEAWTPVKDAF